MAFRNQLVRLSELVVDLFRTGDPGTRHIEIAHGSAEDPFFTGSDAAIEYFYTGSAYEAQPGRLEQYNLDPATVVDEHLTLIGPNLTNLVVGGPDSERPQVDLTSSPGTSFDPAFQNDSKADVTLIGHTIKLVTNGMNHTHLNDGVYVGSGLSSPIKGLAWDKTTAASDASGDVTIAHSLGVAPVVVLVSNGNNNAAYVLTPHSYTSTNFKVRLRVANTGAILTTGGVIVNWLALA